MKAYEIQTNLDAVQAIAEGVADWAERKGFWEKLPSPGTTDSNFNVVKLNAAVERLKKCEKIALMHSELSKLLEELRKPGATSDTDQITNEEAEVADLIIRALDYAGHYKLRIGMAIGLKMAKNEGRLYMHGKNF